jgi:hypothetical protein
MLFFVLNEIVLSFILFIHSGADMLKILVALIFLQLPSLAAALGLEDPKCSIAQVPEWVKPISFEPLDRRNEEDDENMRYLLIDFQINLDENTRLTHVAKALITSEAVQQESLIEIEFDPSYESIILHSLCIHRDSQCIDKIFSSQKQIIQPERDIDDYQYSGRKAWMMFLDDVKTGDVVEYSYSRVGQNPVFQEHYNETFFLQTSIPITHGVYRMIGSQNRVLHFKAHETTLFPVHDICPDSRREWSWEVFDVKPYQMDSSTPSWHLGAPVLQVSEFANWSEVARWGHELFSLPNSYSPEIQQLVDGWKKECSNDDEQIIRALRFVQKEIRYLGIEMGAGTHKPADPNVVLQRRYGDCKDKTLLLRALLALMNINSQPVLVSSSLRDHLGDWHPAVNVFDHVILQIPHDGDFLWIDPTLSNQECCNLEDNICGHFGKGLVLDPQSTDLTEMHRRSPSQIFAETTYTFGSPGEHTLFETKISYRGREADRMRGIYRRYTLKDIEKSYEDYFAEQFGTLKKINPPEVSDDRQLNTFSVAFSYALQDIWKEDVDSELHYFNVFPKHILESLDLNVNPMRSSPFAINHPSHVVEHITLIDTVDEWAKTNLQKSYDSEEIYFLYEKKSDANALHLIYTLMTKKDHVPVDHIGEHRKLLQNIEDQIFMTIRIPMDGSLDGEWGFEKENYAVLGGLAICYGWLITMLTRKRRK